MNAPAARPVETIAPAVARALPAWVYNHPEMTRLEYERILRPAWQIICHVSALKKPGDYVTLELGGVDSVVALRDSQGEIRVFHNVCRHRGARLLDGAGNCPGAHDLPVSRLVLPPERRAARDQLPATPSRRWSARSWDSKPVRMQVLFGFVFVCLAGDPKPLQEIFAGVAAEFAPHRFEEMEQIGSTYIEHWDCDWKIAMDNYLESYHVPIGHPGLNRMFTPDYDDQRNFDGRRARHQLAARAALLALERAHVSADDRKGGDRICPNRTAGAGASTACCRTSASTCSRTRWISSRCCPAVRASAPSAVLPSGCRMSGARCASRATSRLRINRQVQREDESLCRRVQQGLASPQLRTRPAVAARELHARVPQPAARAHSRGTPGRVRRRASPSR